jgi:hypothetical protein
VYPRRHLLPLLAMSALFITPEPSAAPADDVNEDEAKVPAYTLPDPLVMADGRPVTSARQWRRGRRPELLELFAREVYGRSPGRPRGMRFERFDEEPAALGGRAVRRQVRVWFTGGPDGPWMDLLLYLPRGARGPVPAFLGLNFEGNHAVQPDPGIRLSDRWMANDLRAGRVNHRATGAARGSEAARWPAAYLVAQGFALVTAYRGDLEPDHPEGWREGVRAVFPVDGRREARAAATPVTEFAPDAWGCIGAWAWGLSRALDYLEADVDVDPRRVVLFGHSRLGKTALWAAAQDERFAAVISNNSGEGGAALARRRFGERTHHLNARFPHWFCGNFKQYDGREDALPVDQHLLLALAAPRPAYVASAAEDLWADPRGEFLAAVAAGPAYRLLGAADLGTAEMPPLNQPAGAGALAYHVRGGAHDVTDYDWTQYVAFADRQLRR